jgi:malate dehydrogenase (quinone)
VGGEFFICQNEAIIKDHHAKVYGQAAIGAPPMSVPHLDSRLIDGKPVLLFGPYAGFTTKFLKGGSMLDLPESVDIHNIKSLLGAGADNVPLTKYLLEQVMQSDEDRLNALRDFVPDARKEDWKLWKAGYRVQVIKRGTSQWGTLEFGTEVVASEDRTLAALLGASPGASSSVAIMLEVLEKCFPEQVRSDAWTRKLKQMIPSYGIHLAHDPDALHAARELSHGVLGLSPGACGVL